MTSRSGFGRLTALAVLGVLAACSNDVTTAPGIARQADIVTPTDPFTTADNHNAYVCVVSPVGGNYNFGITTTGNPTVLVNPAVVTPGNCIHFATADANAGFGNPDGVTTTQGAIPAGVTLSTVVVEQALYNNQAGGTLVSVTPTNASDPATGVISNEQAVRITYTYTVTPVGNEGCTPGYWKQEHHFDSWVGYLPTATLESVFDVPDGLGLDNVTLVDALSFPGGKGVQGGAQILLRAAVASLLNTTAVQFPNTTQEVIDAVNTALASGDRNTMITLGGMLDAKNNGLGGCPLN